MSVVQSMGGERWDGRAGVNLENRASRDSSRLLEEGRGWLRPTCCSNTTAYPREMLESRYRCGSACGEVTERATTSAEGAPRGCCVSEGRA
jgi:hypothetical protein